MNRYLNVIFFFAICTLFASCGINSEFMFQTPKEFVFDVPEIDSSSIDYTIQPNDIISFNIFTNEGAVMLESSTSTVEASTVGGSTGLNYVVDSRGFVEFPIIGMQKISGMTLAAAQKFVEELYNPQFNRPYVQLKVVNRRIVVFTNPAGSGAVLKLGTESISVIEAIAQAGGVGADAKADEIKLFRNDGTGKRMVYHIDLSTIDGIKYANMSVESGDIIYVESRKLIARGLALEVRSWLSLLVGFTTLLTIQNRL
jgi:polysaccharide export outer membrane protein